MNVIASADENWGIGSCNELLVRIPEDMKYFRELTMGKVVVMGRKTMDSLPDGILQGRVNLVLTHNEAYQSKGAVIVHSLEELHQELEQFPTDDVFVIGGESIYRQLLGQCNIAYITKIDFAYNADAYFPDLDQKKQEWKLIAESEEQTYFDLIYHFRKYRRL